MFDKETVERVKAAMIAELILQRGEYQIDGDDNNDETGIIGIDPVIYVEKLATAATAAAWEWKDPSVELPKKPGKQSYEYVDCLILKKTGDVLFRPWNCEHECFDDEGYDDFYCDASDVKLWCAIVRPAAPEVKP